eukprot:snap_masked-scaffold_29-processed-gene-4.24-mRNA-1 protein AED:0.20 eAED:1.00 QI:0/0/0/1/1/1/2/0/379
MYLNEPAANLGRMLKESGLKHAATFMEKQRPTLAVLENLIEKERTYVTPTNLSTTQLRNLALSYRQKPMKNKRISSFVPGNSIVSEAGSERASSLGGMPARYHKLIWLQTIWPITAFIAFKFIFFASLQVFVLHFAKTLEIVQHCNGIVAFAILFAIKAHHSHEPDPLNIISETTQQLFIAGALFFTYLILEISDPGDLEEDGHFYWVVLLYLVWFIVVKIMVHNPVTLVYSWKNNEGVNRTSDQVLFQLLESSLGIAKLQNQLIDEVSYENFMFFRDVSLWKKQVELEPGWSRGLVLARRIVMVYIDFDSVLEINIGYDSRNAILEYFENYQDGMELDSEIFNESITEVWKLMSLGATSRFRSTPEYMDIFQSFRSSL